MVMSFDVKLPRDVQPVFPQHCCRCMAPSPDARMRFSASRFSWWQVLFVWLWWLRKPVRHEVPVCSDCRPRMRRRKVLEVLAIIAIAVVAILLVMPRMKDAGVGRQWQKLGAIAAFFVIGLPFFVMQAVWPPAFDMTVGEDEVEYEFGNHDFAAAFLVENAEHLDLVDEQDLEYDDYDDDEPDGDARSAGA